MRVTTAIASLLTVGLAAAASRRATCAAQYILDACLTSTTPQLKACEPNDWPCLCEQSNNVLTCYNNCPGDSGQFGAEQTKTSYCNAAKAYSNTSSTSSSQSAVASATSASSPRETSSSSSSSSTSTAGSGQKNAAAPTSSSSSSHSTSTGAAAATGLGSVQGGLVAVVALGLGAVL
ncbi:hypothetical protein BGW36DRAFT_419310 [Talaromyces proteolyticus]|uniref:GPI anchored serine-threonine rich protein n=1 Tax=Talaromyces proteolyticus TaxID=1131652 RepID=A0AAD4PXZ0_9EURO|nr:uncharacterized protein BGW36DRAFT_419310 [Talaromyces proteolyticus]KAH8693288.1 hypothetical protein BGW36DRAFT_419310 [Talaromyces proteolyticus]